MVSREFFRRLCCICIVLLSFVALQVSPAVADNTIRVSMGTTDIKTLDPGFITSTQDSFLADLAFNGLLRFKPGDISQIELDLAESYAISDDGMELTFKLRKGIMSHPFKGHPDGVEITADDVLFLIEKNSNKATSIASNTFGNFTATKVDPYTVVVKLKKRVPNPERAFTSYRAGAIIPRKAYDTLGPRRFKTNPIGTGPFMIDVYQPGQKIHFKANKKYFRGAPKVDGVETLFMPEINSREFALTSNAVDIIDGNKQQAWVEKFSGNKDVTVDVFGPGEVAMLNFNADVPPLNNVKVRQALAYGTDIDSLILFKGKDIAEAICGIISPALPGGLTCEEAAKAQVKHEYNPEKAKALLKEAGFEKGLTIDVVSSERSSFRLALENLQAQWKKIGVNMNLEVVDHSTFHTKIRQTGRPVVLYIAQRLSANDWLQQFFLSSSAVPKGSSPITNFSNCTVIDELILGAQSEVNQAKQVQMWKDAQLTILKDAYALPLYVQLQVWAHRNAIDYGYELKSTYVTAPQITELTTKK